MSAHVPSKLNVDLLVRRALDIKDFSWWQVDEEGRFAGWHKVDEFARRYGYPETTLEPSQLGQILVNEAVMSVHHRYPDTEPDAGDLPGPVDAYYMGPYVYENPKYTLNPGETFATIDYFSYQACEHDGWETSEAFQFLTGMRATLCKQVDGYGDAPWGWDSVEDLGSRALDQSVRIL